MGYSQLFQLPPPNGVVAPVVNITSVAQTINYLGSESWSGYYIDSYKGTATPNLNISTKEIAFLGTGTIWDISIKNGGGTEVIFLPCQEGVGNVGTNRTVHNQYANDLIKHFVLSSNGLWKDVVRQDTYKLGYSLKKNISGLTDNMVTNSGFDTNVAGWAAGLSATISWIPSYMRVTGSSSYSGNGYQPLGNIYGIFTYTHSSRQRSGTSSRTAHSYISIDNYLIIQGGVGVIQGTTISSLSTASTSFTSLSARFSPSSHNVPCWINSIIGSSEGVNGDYDDVNLNVYEDDVKIPLLLTDTNKDCFGNVKTEIPDLVAYYPFNGNANDESGNVFDGTVNGATLTTNRFGIANTAYMFDGVSNYINLTTTNVLTTDVFTWNVWINTTDISANQTRILNRDDNNSLDRYGWAIIKNNSDVIFIVISGASPYNITTLTFGTVSSICNGKWQMLTVVWRKSATIEIYLNSKFLDIDTDISNNSFITSTLYPIIAGTVYPSFGGEYFDGKIDDIRIYSKALSNAEIKALYRQTPTTAL